MAGQASIQDTSSSTESREVTMGNEKRDTSGDRYVAVALVEAGSHAHRGVLDRERGEVAQFLGQGDAKLLSDGALPRDVITWTPADRMVILGELGPVPERIVPPFVAEEFELHDADNEHVSLAVGRTRRGEVELDLSETTIDACAYGLINPLDAPAVASAILRAAGLDVESVVLPKGGE